MPNHRPRGIRRQKLRRGVLLLFLLLFPIVLNYMSPYVSLYGAAVGVISGSLLFFGALFLISLFLGRSYCAWVCPGGAVQAFCLQINNRRVRSALDRIKYFIWVPWFAAMIVLAVLAGGFKVVDPLFLTDSGISVDHPSRYIIYYFVLVLVVVPALVFGRRGMCHSLCWMAPFMILGRKLRNRFRWPALRLQAETADCTDCQRCVRNCPMSLDVNALVHAETMEHSECILCGQCVDNCPQKVLKFRFSAGTGQRISILLER